jgi:flagellar P-ring protein precursor FlgI
VPVALVVACWLGLPGDLTAQQQLVKDFVEVEGQTPVQLRGYGVVVGLSGNGDSPGGKTEEMIRNFLANLRGEPIAKLNIKNVAGVVITATIRPSQKVGTAIDVSVSALGDAKTLHGGTLLMTTLRGVLPRGHVSGKGDISYAVAQGALIVDGDEQLGNLTHGVVLDGAIVQTEISTKDVVKDDPDFGKYVTLLLRRPDYNLASRLASEINDTQFPFTNKDGNTVYLKVAYTQDAGSIDVRIPTEKMWDDIVKTEYPEFESEPVLFLNRILSTAVNVPTIPRRAIVTINDATKSVAWTGTVIVRQGQVRVGNITVGYPDKEVKLGEIIELATKGAATQQDIVNIVRALDSAGLLEAEVRSQ